ncbi:MAG: sialate O-acetylesterase [Chthoniobacterales bacterium]|nr:sialate O-acetylesterase [Chthoniobacterales bacterium]
MNFFLCFGLLVSFLLATVRADVTMPAIFGDHMVLQQGTSLPIWGEADPGERVTVKFVGQQVTTTARKDRQWRVNLQPVYLRSSPDILMVDGKNHLEFSDVLVGDVWLCSGQSNMAFPLRDADGGEEAIIHAEDHQLRFFVVTEKRAFQPQRQVEGRWERSSPEVAAGFSAVSYFFGRDLRMATGMPVGLIGSYCGGSSAQAWMSFSALQQAPSFSHYLAQYHQIARDFPKNSEVYSQRKADYQQELAAWEEMVGVPYQKELEAWTLKCKEACSKLWAQPLKPDPLSQKPTPPFPPDGGVTSPTLLFNAMIAPLIPYAITGVIWYQGESNENRESPHSWMTQFPSSGIDNTVFSVVEYRRLFQRLIRSWRAAWGEGPFPFYFVSLAGFRKSTLDPVEMLINDEGDLNPGWAWLREGQAVALSLPETGMAEAVDIGNPNDIHPKDKLDVGRRLALLARKNLYGQQVVASGPTYRSMKQEGKTLRLTFDNVGKGLTVAAPPSRYDGTIVMLCSLQGFAIAGDDRHWYDAIALIDGSDVIVSSEFVSKPTAVRYNWKDNPTGNLYNKDGLPAAPFRTDLDQPK